MCEITYRDKQYYHSYFFLSKACIDYSNIFFIKIQHQCYVLHIMHSFHRYEVSYILKTSFVKGFSTALSVFTERFILFAAVVTFVLMGGDIRAQTAFSLVQYFNLLQLTCNISLPLGLSFLAETKVTIRRLEVSYDKKCLQIVINLFLAIPFNCYRIT